MQDRLERPPRRIARQLALGFGAVSAVAILMCGYLLFIVQDVSGLVETMRDEERTLRHGRELATDVRELSLHIAHTVLGADESHLADYAGWRDRVEQHLEVLAPSTTRANRAHVEGLREAMRAMHAALMRSALPAARRGDLAGARAAQRELESLGEDAAAHADALALAMSSEMAHAHDLATRSTRAGLVAGLLSVTLMLALSFAFTARFRAAVFRPLEVLTDAARRFGRGEFDHRVGDVGRGELRALAVAFDRMADELGHREARLVRNERMAAIGQLAAGVAHELNNPIGIIRGYLKTMRPDEDPGTLGEELAILDEEAEHCQRIAEDLLSYARSGELTVAPVAIAPFLEATAARFLEGPAGRGRDVDVSAEAADVQCDPARLRQVVLNLLANAAIASDPGKPIVLRGSTEAEGGYRIDVDDHGPGVPPGERARVFEPFYTTRRGGSGLGLSVCLGIVRAHGGTIDVEEAETGGARFRVRLPRVQPSPRPTHSPGVA